jgi:glyceraldehyde 3-phosphate dehydrogenase
MAVNVAINGFGRIGRLVLRGIIESGRKDINVVAINDLGSIENNAHMLKYDSVHGTLAAKVKATKTGINVNGKAIKVIAERDPANLPWEKMGVDIALECTGLFTSKETAGKHITAGAKRVLVSAPASGADLTVVYGVNHKKLKKSHKIVSNASCTTNCLAPVAQVLDKNFGIARGYMTTIHAFTGDQSTVDTLHSDPRRARAASLSMIPTSTGAAKAVGLVLPELAGRLDGTAVRVPTPNVSMIDLVFEAKKKTTVEAVNAAILKASNGPLKGILGVCDEPLVSIDFNHSPFSSTFDLTQTQIVDGKLVRVLSWYDNEWGFANRMADTAVAMGKL